MRAAEQPSASRAPASRPAGQTEIRTKVPPKPQIFGSLVPDPFGFSRLDSLRNRQDLNAIGAEFRRSLDEQQQFQQQIEQEILLRDLLSPLRRPEPAIPQPRIRDLRFTGLPSPIGNPHAEFLAGINTELFRRRLFQALGGGGGFQAPMLGLSQGLRGTIF